MVAVPLLLGLWLIVAGIAGIVLVASPGIGVATLAVLVGIGFIVRGLALIGIGWLAGTGGRGGWADGPPEGWAAAPNQPPGEWSDHNV